MNILTLENISKAYSERSLFEKASFYLQEGEKVGVIGINGTGKSTLLRIILGDEEPDEGRVIRANNLVIRMLSQHPTYPENMSVIDCAMSGNEKDEQTYEIIARAKQMLAELGVTDYDAKIQTLSGGSKKKVAIVQTLLAKSDVLVLDEPTNHLDSRTSAWLEQALIEYRGAVILVTHDRYFLDSVTKRIIEIDHGAIYSYDTNYSGFLERKAQREESEDAAERKRKSILRTELEWVQRGARARTTKQKARLERYEELKNRKAPVRDGSVEMSSVSTRMGRTTIELHAVTKGYDRTLFQDFTYFFLKGDRIGFIGENGCGKTTLMKLIAGLEQPDSGEVVIGQTVKIGYYTQEFARGPEAGVAYMDPSKRVIDYIRDTAEYVQTTDGLMSASVMLDRFLFPPNEQYARIEKLSGGEKKRLNLLRVLMEAPNVLILDEPTNDLDIQTLTILEDYLDHFDGIVIVVSHDRYFLDRVVRRLFAFEEGRIRQFEGGYSEYALVRGMEEELAGQEASVSEQPVKEEKTAKVDHTKRVKFTYAEQRDYDSIEGEIAGLETRIADLEKEIATNARDFVKLNKLIVEKEQAESLLEEKMDRWMYLTDKMDQIQNG